MSYEVLYIIIPIVTTPILTFITWYISHIIENKLKSRKEDKLTIKDKINNFYWPLHIYLSRYNKILYRYNNIKSGNISLSSSSSLSPSMSDDIENINETNLNIIMDEYVYLLIDSLNKIKQLYEESLPPHLDTKILDAIIKMDDYITFINVCKKANTITDEYFNSSIPIMLMDIINSQIYKG